MHEPSRYPRPFGKYMLVRQLAIGGMAEVYLARTMGPAGFEKECVIKRILPQLASDQQFVQMFLDEARIAARLSHPHIVQIFDLGQVDNDFYLAMEYVRGVDLEQIIDAEKARGGRVPLAIACRILANTAEGLDHAHRALDGRGHPLGLVHRDVSPSNVIVSFDGVAKVLDFGIAKATPLKTKTEIGVIKGKIPYMSPEQVEGQALDARSDIFALGTLMFEMTVGKKPFDGTNPAEVTLQILNKELSRGPLMITGTPDALFLLLKKAHAKHRDERYPSARDFQLALESFLAHSRLACTSHDVAAYVETLFPGARERSEAESAELPIEVTDPTIPAAASPLPTPHSHSHSHTGATPQPRRQTPLPDMMAAGGPDEPGGEPPVLGDLSSHNLGNYEDVKRNLGGGGRGTMFIVLALIVAVAAGFWILKSRQSEAPPPEPPKAAAPPPPPVEKPKAEGPKPEAKPEPPVAPPAAPEPVVEKPAAVEPKAEPPKPAANPAKPAKPASKPKPAKKPAEAPRALPKLPTPPPADDAP